MLVVASLAGSASSGEASPAPHSSPAPGYWLVGDDGGVFAFDAPFEGSGAPTAGSSGLCPGTRSDPRSTSLPRPANSGQVVSDVNCVGIAGSQKSSGYGSLTSPRCPRHSVPQPHLDSWAAPV